MPAELKDIFRASAQGRVLDRLRRAPQTVDELASTLGVTGNAVRSHLSALEREGLVRRGELRPGKRRPSQTYRLAPRAEALFCQAYAPFLESLLRVAARRLRPAELEDLLRRAGRGLAASPAGRSLRGRVKAAAALLERLGGVTRVEASREGAFILLGASCPLAAAVRAHASVCDAVETLVAEMTRSRARQRCRRTEQPPQCRIEVAARPLAARAARS